MGTLTFAWMRSFSRPEMPREDLGLRKIPVLTGSLLTGQFWEQLELPCRTQGRLLVSLCNLAPIATRHAVTMIHDAQVHITPQSYSRPFRLFYKTMQPIMGRRHRRILTVSGYSRGQLDLAHVAQADNITVLHNGADHVAQVTAQMGTAASFGLTPKHYVLALSNTQPHKNIRVLLEAFALPQLAPLKLALFGGVGKEAFVDADLSVPDNVAFLGPVSDEALVSLMKDALCLGFPSTTEGFGLPPLEAMACGCPALVAPCAGLAGSMRRCRRLCGTRCPGGLGGMPLWHSLSIRSSMTQWLARGRPKRRNLPGRVRRTGLWTS